MYNKSINVLKRAFHSGETPFFFFTKMAQKWLKNLLLLTLMTLILAVPLKHSQAAVFDAQKVVELVNQDRAKLNVPALEADIELSQAALEKANDMISHNYFAHVSPTGVTPWEWIGQSGYDYSFAGENLAINFTDPQAQHAAFMQSESHKKNILNPKYKEIGVAVIAGKINGKQTIITVQEFGAKTTALTAEKKVAGVSNSKNQTTPASGKNSFFEKMVSIAAASINATENAFLDFSRQLSLNPFDGFLYTCTLLITLAFFLYEAFAAHLHFAAHFISLHNKPKFSLFDKVNPQAIHASPFNLNFLIYLKRKYLTHMKLKK